MHASGAILPISKSGCDRNSSNVRAFPIPLHSQQYTSCIRLITKKSCIIGTNKQDTGMIKIGQKTCPINQTECCKEYLAVLNLDKLAQNQVCNKQARIIFDFMCDTEVID